MKTEIATKFRETEIGTIPEEWDVKALGEVLDITSSKRIFMSEYVGSGVPFYRGKEIIEKAKGNKNISTPLYISEKRFSEIVDKFGSPQEGDILMSSVGTLGVSYQVEKGERFYFKDGNLTWFRNYAKQIWPKYIQYWLRSSAGQRSILSVAIGSTQPALTIDSLKKITLAIPTIVEQKQITEIVSSLDDKLELNRKINANLESLASSLFKKWFVDIGDELPEGWEIKPLSSFGEIVCGKTPSKSIGEYFGDDIPFIKIPDMHGNVFIVKTEDTLTSFGMDSQKNKTISSGSICVSCIATVGLVSMPTKNSQTNQQINSIIPSEGFYQFYLFHALKNLSGYLQRMGSSGSATLNVNTKSFASINIVKPDDETLKKFDTLVRPIFEQIKIKAEEASNLSVVRDSLLPRLMSGKIRVNINI
jgi:type I restriction enzyme S subunit